MVYEIYIDVLAVNIFFADFAALWAVNVFMSRGRRVHRIIAGAASGAIGSCLLFLICKNTAAYLLLVHFLLNPLVLYLSFREKSRKDFWTDLGISYCMFLFLGGTIEWLYTGGNGYFSYEAAGGCALVLLIAAAVIGKRQRKNRARYLEVQIRQEETCICVQALNDSGNLLTDPYTGMPVSLIDRAVYEAAYGPPKAVRLIPYESLGCRHGMLEAVTVNELRFTYENQDRKICHAVLGMAGRALFEKKPYQMILNPQELLEEKKKIQ